MAGTLFVFDDVNPEKMLFRRGELRNINFYYKFVLIGQLVADKSVVIKMSCTNKRGQFVKRNGSLNVSRICTPEKSSKRILSSLLRGRANFIIVVIVIHLFVLFFCNINDTLEYELKGRPMSSFVRCLLGG